MWSGVGDIVWDTKTWVGVGSLVGISEVQENRSTEAQGIAISLSGVPQENVSLAISEARQGAPVRIWLGLFDDSGALVADPFDMFTGRLDVPEIVNNVSTCTITISYENKLIDLQRSREFRYTDESHQIDYPGDLGFEFVTAIQNDPVEWGTK